MNVDSRHSAALVLPAPQAHSRAQHMAPRWIVLSCLLAATGLLEPVPVFVGFVVLLVACVSLQDFRISLPPARLLLPLVSLVALGASAAWLHHGFGGGEVSSRDVARDAWRFGEPAALVLVGWTLMRRREDLDGLLSAVLLGATLASIAHLAGAIMHLDRLEVGRHAFRQEVGSGSFLSALALALVLGLKLERARAVRLPFGLQNLAVVVCAASLVLSLSRTWWLACALLVLVLVVRRSGAVRSSSTGLVTLGALVAGGLLAVPEDAVALATGSLKDAMVETMTARSYVEPSELNRFWRSYEAWCAVEHLKGASPVEVSFGQGLGTRLDLGLYQQLDGEMRREIPVLHNGYLEAALKVGLLGVLVYVGWLCAWIREGLKASKRDARSRVMASLTVGLALVLVGTGQVVGGAFNPRATAGLVVLLAAFARWNRLVRAERLTSPAVLDVAQAGGA